MLARLLALAAVLSFSFAPLAQTTATPEEQQRQMKLLISCGEMEAAKHITLLVGMALAAAFSPSIQEQLKPYEEAMKDLKTCEQVAAGYQILVDVTVANGGNLDEMFNTPEAKAALEEMIIELRKIK